MSIKFLSGVLLTVATSALWPLDAAHATGTCTWGGASGPIRYVANLGALYIPRDAKVGDPIGPINRTFLAGSGSLSILCKSDGRRLTFSAVPAGPTAHASVPPSPGMDLHGTLMETNVEGVGARISLGSPYDGITNGFWKLVGLDSSVPMGGYIDFITPLVLQHSTLRGHVTLVKTGVIARGVQPLDGGLHLVKASFTGIPDAFTLAFSGSVTQAECSLSANPVSADPVRLGDWPTSVFTGEGTTSDAVPFSIALNSCLSGPLAGGGVTSAYIRLDPVDGSKVMDAGRGVFSLGTGATAKGIGIQILGRDGVTPTGLETQIAQGSIPFTGGMLLEFNARYYQTGPTREVSAGSADASLAFTITYQ